MESEEEFNQNVWYILQKIRTNYNQNNPANPIRYNVNLIRSNNDLNILKKLEGWNIIKIFQRKLKENLYVIIYFHVIEPTFGELYRKLKSLNEIEPSQEIKDSNQKLFFPKHFLRQEIDQFQSVLRHFVNSGAISNKDFQFLTLTIKMIRTLIKQGIQEDIQRPLAFPDQKIRNEHFKFSDSKKPYQPSLFSKPQPIPIVGEIVVPGLNERLEALKPKSTEYSGPKFPYKIPAGTYWNNVIIKFLDNERIEILVKKFKHETDYKEMGMVGKGNVPEPNEQWVFLRVLAQFNGELTIKDSGAKDKYKKHKQTLTETLRNYFSIDYDPFYPYQSSPEKAGNSYKIKLFLIPPPLKDKPKPIMIDDPDTDSLGIQEFLDETAPQI